MEKVKEKTTFETEFVKLTREEFVEIGSECSAELIDNISLDLPIFKTSLILFLAMLCAKLEAKIFDSEEED